MNGSAIASTVMPNESASSKRLTNGFATPSVIALDAPRNAVTPVWTPSALSAATPIAAYVTPSADPPTLPSAPPTRMAAAIGLMPKCTACKR